MKIKKQIRKCEFYAGEPHKEIPWEVRRVFPDIDVGCTGISFSVNGEYVTIDEAAYALEYLLNELK